MTKKLTVAQALIYPKNQYVVETVLKIASLLAVSVFGYGNVVGLGEALKENKDFRYYQTRNEQSMVHTAAAFSK